MKKINVLTGTSLQNISAIDVLTGLLLQSLRKINVFMKAML